MTGSERNDWETFEATDAGRRTSTHPVADPLAAVDEGPAAAARGAHPDDGQLGQRLVDLGRLTARQLRRVRALQHKRGISFETALVQSGLVKREELMAALSRRFSYPIVDAHGTGQAFSRELFVGHEPFGPSAEELRSIRATLAATSIAQGVRSFAVTACHRQTGSTYFAGNLAIGFAQMALPTLLVDANMHTPRVASMFGLPEGHAGLSEVLNQTGTGAALPIVQEVLPNLSILTCGALAPNPQELLASAMFVAQVNNFQAQFGVVIYDTAPALEYADAMVVSARVGAAVLVARQHKSTYADISTVSQKLDAIQCKLLGTVLNRW